MSSHGTASSPQELGRFLRQARLAQGLSQRQLAVELGTSQAYVSELETGKDSLALTRVFDVIRLTGITLKVELPLIPSPQGIRLSVDQNALAAICSEYGIAELAVFGSVASGTDHPDSDVDVLYTLKEGVRLGWAINDLSDDLANLLGRPVDLVGKRALHPRLSAKVLSESQVIYAA
jgi:predicted nucleotidyltransferase